MRNYRRLAVWLVPLLAGAAAARGEDAPGKDFKRFADIPAKVIGMTTVVLNREIHVLGGAASDAHQVFLPATDTWVRKAPLPAPEGIGWGMATVFRGKIYFFGGGYGNDWLARDLAWVYDPEPDRWTAIAPMPMKRMQGAAVATESAIYIFGGHLGSQQTARGEETRVVHRYDPRANSYRRVADMPEKGIFIVSAYHKGNIFVIPGVERTDKDLEQGYVWATGLMKYNPSRDAWTKLNTPRVYQSAWSVTQQSSHVAIGSKLYYGGGGVPPKRVRTDTLMYYDMDQDRFVAAGRLPRVRCCAGGGVVDGKLYIVGGFYNVTGDRCPETWGYPFADSPKCCGN